MCGFQLAMCPMDMARFGAFRRKTAMTPFSIRPSLIFATFLSLLPALAFADFTGPVVSVLDDDIIEVLNGHHAERVRLSGIDCPEKGQAFGHRAKQAASDLAFGKEVTIQTHGYDKYKRTLADVILPDGTNMNHTLVKDGWCWWYRKYVPRNVALEQLETEARKRGEACGPTRIPCRRGSGERGVGERRVTGRLIPPPHNNRRTMPE